MEHAAESVASVALVVVVAECSADIDMVLAAARPMVDDH